MLLFKFVPTEEIARQVSTGRYRFYELTKYRKIEEKTGRSDPFEGSIKFTEDEVRSSAEKLPIASFNGVEFPCVSISLSDDYLRQYFVFCMSTNASESAIDGCGYRVELNTDIFDTFELLLPTPHAPTNDTDGTKFFSHAPIEYYDIQNHPAQMKGDLWKEVYVKHSDFSQQREYRAAMFVSDHFFDRAGKAPLTYVRPIRDNHGTPFDFDLSLLIRSGRDPEGWRYLELDISEFQAKLLQAPLEIKMLQN